MNFLLSFMCFIFQVDGDTDTQPVQDDFINVVKEHIEYMKTKLQENTTNLSINQQANGFIPNGHTMTGTGQTTNNPGLTHQMSNGHVPNGHIPGDTELEDFEPRPIETISQKVSNGVAHTLANGVQNLANGHAKIAVANGFVANGHAPMYSEHI